MSDGKCLDAAVNLARAIATCDQITADVEGDISPVIMYSDAVAVLKEYVEKALAPLNGITNEDTVHTVQHCMVNLERLSPDQKYFVKQYTGELKLQLHAMGFHDVGRCLRE